jgi:hypothetical protein
MTWLLAEGGASITEACNDDTVCYTVVAIFLQFCYHNIDINCYTVVTLLLQCCDTVVVTILI